MKAAPTTSLRPALQLAMVVARQGETQAPPIACPARLRPLLSFAKAPAAALELCRRVVDEDETFRMRVAAATTVEEVGAIGWLWLTRPDGWEATTAELQAQLERELLQARVARGHDELERRQQAAEAGAVQAEQARRVAVTAMETAQREAADARRQQRELAAERDRALESLVAAEQERRQLLRQLKATEAAVVLRTNEIADLRNRLARPLWEALDSPSSFPGSDSSTPVGGPETAGGAAVSDAAVSAGGAPGSATGAEAVSPCADERDGGYPDSGAGAADTGVPGSGATGFGASGSLDAGAGNSGVRSSGSNQAGSGDVGSHNSGPRDLRVPGPGSRDSGSRHSGSGATGSRGSESRPSGIGDSRSGASDQRDSGSRTSGAAASGSFDSGAPAGTDAGSGTRTSGPDAAWTFDGPADRRLGAWRGDRSEPGTSNDARSAAEPDVTDRARWSDPLREAVQAASIAAEALARALADAARSLDQLRPLDRPSPAALTVPEPQAEREPVLESVPVPAARAEPVTAPPRANNPARRRALRMPPGTFEDGPHAAWHLSRVPNVVLLIDGYNVSKLAWPGLELAHQRERLIDALVTLQARTGARAEVVFDGVDQGHSPARHAPERLHVEFTPAEQEADDRLLELVDATPLHRPVVVVSTDRRVRDGARQRGANTLSAAQLLALLR